MFETEVFSLRFACLEDALVADDERFVRKLGHARVGEGRSLRPAVVGEHDAAAHVDSLLVELPDADYLLRFLALEGQDGQVQAVLANVQQRSSSQLLFPAIGIW